MLKGKNQIIFEGSNRTWVYKGYGFKKGLLKIFDVMNAV